MEIQVYELLRDNWLLLLFLVLGLGYLVGNLRIAGTPVGSTIGVLLAGLAFGHFDLEMDPGVSTFGFALFIFSVGIEAGPSFFSAFREDGPKYIALAAIVAVTGMAIRAADSPSPSASSRASTPACWPAPSPARRRSPAPRTRSRAVWRGSPKA